MRIIPHIPNGLWTLRRNFEFLRYVLYILANTPISVKSVFLVVMSVLIVGWGLTSPVFTNWFPKPLLTCASDVVRLSAAEALRNVPGANNPFLGDMARDNSDLVLKSDYSFIARTAIEVTEPISADPISDGGIYCIALSYAYLDGHTYRNRIEYIAHLDAAQNVQIALRRFIYFQGAKYEEAH